MAFTTKNSQNLLPNKNSGQRTLVSRLVDVADVVFLKAAKSRADIEAFVTEFNGPGYDGIMIVMLLYSSGFRLLRALERNRLPILLANIQPLPTVTPDWDWSRLTTNQGIHGAQDSANMILQSGLRGYPCGPGPI